MQHHSLDCIVKHVVHEVNLCGAVSPGQRGRCEDLNKRELSHGGQMNGKSGLATPPGSIQQQGLHGRDSAREEDMQHVQDGLNHSLMGLPT